MGDIAMQENNSDEALALLRKAVAMKNDIDIAYIDLGAVLSQKGQYQDAVAALRCRTGSQPA
jgi:predicted Zn-dependent protease